MCGIFGFAGAPDRQLLGRMAAALVHRGPDDAGAFEHARGEPRPPPPQHHRPRRRPPADGQRRRDRVAGLQRRDLQLPRAARPSSRPPATSSAPLRHRSHRPRLRGVGPGLRGALQRHVGLSPSPTCAAPARAGRRQARAEPRPLRHQAALLRALAAAAAVCCSPARSRRCCRIPSWRPAPDEQMIFEYLLHGFHDHRAETFFAGIYHVPAATWIEVPLTAASGAQAAAGASGGPGLLTAPLASTSYWTPVLPETAAPTRPTFRRLLPRQRRAAPRQRGAGGLVPLRRPRLHHHRELHERAAREDAPDAASLRGQLKTFSAVFDGDPIDEREYIETAVAEHRRRHDLHQSHLAGVHRRAARLRLAPGGAHRQHRAVRAVVRHALRARAGDRAARRPGRRRAASPATCPTSSSTCASSASEGR